MQPGRFHLEILGKFPSLSKRVEIAHQFPGEERGGKADLLRSALHTMSLLHRFCLTLKKKKKNNDSFDPIWK